MILKQWNEKLQYLKKIIYNAEKIDEIKEIILELHGKMFVSEMSEAKSKTFEDELWENLDEETIRNSTNEKGRTIAYGIWHSTRIEDITVNILINDSNQIFEDGDWQKKIKSPIKDTGNALTTEKILEFSCCIDIEELKKYRIAVGKKTGEIIKNLSSKDLKRKMKKESLNRILEEGAVENVEGSNWLIDFWGRKNVAGIIFMPVLRHHSVYLNESLKAKKRKNKGT